MINAEQLKKRSQNLAYHGAKAIAGTFISRTCGIFRTLIINAIFGANSTLDAFNVAFRFPNSLRDLFADGALSAAFIKVLVDIEPQGDEALRQLLRIACGFFLMVTLSLAALGVVYAKHFLLWVSGHQFAIRGNLSLAIQLFQILVFYLPITMLNAVVMAVLSLKGDTFRAMNGSIFLSVGMIIGATLLAPELERFHMAPILGLAIGAMLGAGAQLIYQLYPLKQWGLLVLPNFNPQTWWNYRPLHQVLRLMAPRALGQGALILALVINTFFAIQIGAGAITYVTTTVMVIQVPIGLFGVATGFAALPVLSAAFNQQNRILFNDLLIESIRMTQWLSLMTLIMLVLLIVPTYVVVFQHGRITFHDTIQNSIAICAYGIGIFFATQGKILLNTLYAVNATRQIIFNSFIYLLVNSVMSAVLAPRFGLVGLGCSFATATAVDCWLNGFVVWWVTRQQFNTQPMSSEFNVLNVRFFVLSLCSYGIGLLGVALTYYVWPNFTYFTGFTLNIKLCLLILISFGSVLTGIFILLARQYGPTHLQQIIRKFF